MKKDSSLTDGVSIGIKGRQFPPEETYRFHTGSESEKPASELHRATCTAFVQFARKTCLVTIFFPVGHSSMISQKQEAGGELHEFIRQE